MSKAKLLTAIAIIPDPVTQATRGLKYRNIKNSDNAKNEFYEFVKKKFPNVSHVNWYEKSSTFGKATVRGMFIEKIYLQ